MSQVGVLGFTASNSTLLPHDAMYAIHVYAMLRPVIFQFCDRLSDAPDRFSIGASLRLCVFQDRSVVETIMSALTVRIRCRADFVIRC